MNAHPLELRRRIFNYNLSHSVRNTAKIFGVSPDTVQRLKQLFIETGDLAPRPCHAEHAHAVSPEGELYVQALLVEQPDLSLAALGEEYERAYGVAVGTTTLHHLLQRLGFSRKKKTFYDPKKGSAVNQAKKDSYINQIKTIPPEDCLYLDETGSCLDATLAYGRSRCGERVYDAKPTAPGERLSVVAVLTGQGIVAEYLYRGTLTAKVFIAYLETYLLPLLTQGKTLIMDNLPAHHAKRVKQFLQSHNIAYLFTPPYSPEFNPIEEAFSKTKHVVRQEKPRTLETLEEAFRKGLKSVTGDDAINYINHSYNYVYVTD